MTRIVEQLLEAKSSKVTDDYRYLDPKMLRVTDRYSTSTEHVTCVPIHTMYQ